MKDLWGKKNKIKQACLSSCVLLPQHQPSEYPCPHWVPLLLTFGTLISLGEFGFDPFPSKPVNKTFATFFVKFHSSQASTPEAASSPKCQGERTLCFPLQIRGRGIRCWECQISLSPHCLPLPLRFICLRD